MLVQEFQLLLLAQAFYFACSSSPPTWLRPRDSKPGCMDPLSQPVWMPNSNCPSSLTSPSRCVSSSAYKKNCLAYCEQYLYWFLGPEVPFSDATCEPYTPCTFAGQKSLSFTNSYSFSGDLTAKVPVEELEAAFNLGATYTYSQTSATSQTLTSTRPNETFGDCGYWTFLPYYVTSCGFYITGVNIKKRIPEDEQCGGLFCQRTPFTCSNDYNLSFSCTNTTYLDSSGNAQGVTIFVATNCYSNERLSPREQDPRYDNTKSDVAVLDELAFEVLNATDPIDQLTITSDPVLYGTPDPPVLPTCLRGCLCGYSSWGYYVDATIYNFCDCQETLPNMFFYIASTLQPDVPLTTIYTTPTNLSLLLLYDVDLGYFNASIAHLIDHQGTTFWMNISEGSNLTLQKGFECFGNYETILEVMPLAGSP